MVVDGKEIGANEGQTILEATRKVGIRIPTLCYHEAVSASGACRFCSVEITTKRGRSRVVVSCLYPVEEGLVVKTHSEKVLRLRRGIIELLLSRCPTVSRLQELAKELRVNKPRFKLGQENCIVCGLCIRVCEEIAGVSAISAVNRGTKKEIAPPFFQSSQVCIGCGGCAYVCPTRAIRIENNQIKLGSKVFKDLSQEASQKVMETLGSQP
jgi:NADH dehydrogenase/NADH:ubiquinone oxidoreductase subunit G